VELTGQPAWQIGAQEGSARRLNFDLRNGVSLARGEVRTKLPPGALGQSAWLLPASARRTNVVATGGMAGGSSTNRPIEITSDELEFRLAASDEESDVVVYRGRVWLGDAGQMELTCDTLTAQRLAGRREMETVVAEGGVELNIVEPQRRLHMRGDKAVYLANRKELELTGATGVEIVVTDSAGVSQVRGTRAVYDPARDVLFVDGRPIVTSPHGRVEGDLITMDRANSTLRVSGEWKLKIPVEALKKAEQSRSRQPNK
jgi:lipopolysaccharide transport protein LptA